MRVAARIAVGWMFVAVLGLSGCELETSDLLAADQLIERLDSGGPDSGSVAKRAGTGTR